MKNVTFGYSPLEAPLITEFSISLKPGSRVAVVGKSGCGKSTIANLVSGLYKPWNGEILLDSKPRQTISGTTLNNSIAMVDQNLFLFEGTVKENITFWDETIADKDVIQVAKDACIHEEIAARPGSL
jgi:ABC-type bacteriocin/lantibiotic exporter with double-glycine peptidase domain